MEENNKQETDNTEKQQDNVVITRGSAKKQSGDGINKNPIQRHVAPMDDAIYIAERLDKQMNWYDAKSSYNQKKYKKLKKWEIIISASIPLIIALSTMSAIENCILWDYTATVDNKAKTVILLSLASLFQIVAALCGVFMVVLNKFFELEGYYDNWKKYRTTAEEMQQEKIKYLTHADPYDEEDAFPVLVSNIEGILNKENMTWQQTMSKVKTSGLRKKAQSSIDNMFEENKKKGKKQDSEEETESTEEKKEENNG